MNISICSRCGGELKSQGDDTFKCKFCGAVFREDTVQKQKDALSSILDEENMKRVSALKQELWKKVNEEYSDSVAIVRICQDIKKLDPDDFYANFYEAANAENEDAFISELENMDVLAHYDDVEEVLNYSFKSISKKNMLAICNLIEKAFKQNDLSKYNEYRSKYDEQVALIDKCVYDPAYPRDAFICYSSKDMPKVESLVKFLEDQGLYCFVAVRNLQHGRGAVANYWKALHTAMENCECIVFVSSVNSRSQACDALEELRYILTLEQKLNKKIKKIEYLIDNYTGAPVERNFKKIFDGLEYCYDEDTVYDRITWEEPTEVPESLPELNTKKEVKYCTACGKENPDNAKFCLDCGGDEFVSTQAEWIDFLKNKKKELEELQEKERAAALQRADEDARREIRDYFDDAPATRNDTYNDEAAIAERNRVQQEIDAIDDYLSGNMTFVDVDVPQSERRKRNYYAEYYSGSDRYELLKGQSVLLPQEARSVKVTVKNDYKLDNVEADTYVFLLGNNDRVLSESDLVFFGNETSLNKSVVMNESCDEVEIRFNKVNQDITKIRFVMSFNMEDGKKKNFSMLNSSTFTFYLEDQAYSFEMTDVGRFQSVSAFEFIRLRNKWKLNIQAAGLKEEIADICSDYGIDVE